MTDIDLSNVDDFNDRAGLRNLLEGRTDDEINEFIDVLGIDQLFDMVIPAVVERFDPDKTAGQSATVQFDVTDTAGTTHSFNVVVKDGSCSGGKGPGEEPRMTLVFQTPGFLRFLAGTLDPMAAFMGGQLKVIGDMMFAMQFQGWFKMD